MLKHSHSCWRTLSFIAVITVAFALVLPVSAFASGGDEADIQDWPVNEHAVLHVVSGSGQDYNVNLPPFIDYRLMDGGAQQGKQLILYGTGQSHQALDLFKLTFTPFPKYSPGVETDNFDELVSDRMHKQETYVVKNGRTLYRLNVSTKQYVKLFESSKQIYGVSSSPDGKYAALLITTDKYEGPGADLHVFSREGKLLRLRQNAAFLSHSDGMFSMYPMRFSDKDTIEVLTEYAAHTDQNAVLGTMAWKWRTGEKGFTPTPYANIKGNVMTVPNDEAKFKTLPIPKNLSVSLTSMENERPLVHYSPDRKSFVYQVHNDQLWLYSFKTSKWKKIGQGTFVNWLSDSKLIWLERYHPFIRV